MLKIFLFLSLHFTTASLGVYAQQCGNGTFTVEISGAREVEYKLFSLTPKGNYTPEQVYEWRLKTFFPGEKETILYTAMQGMRIENKIAEKFLKNYESGNFRGIHDDESASTLSGLSRHGFIQFPTFEVHTNLYLLKLSAKKRDPVYLIGNYLGGCRGHQKVQFEDIVKKV